jgi:3-methyl-2-oxobutanoate hydroxymethyltransferase
MLPKVQAIADAGIPVVGHFGVGDRSLLEGFLPRGRCADDAHRLVDLIEAAIDAGVVMVLLEHVSEELSRWCWQNLPVPVLSLGSGPYAHGQFHVSSDIIGCSATPVPPKRQAFANVWGVMQEAYTAYMEAARSGAFPQSDHVHRMRGDEHERFLALMETRDRRG